jgi:Luciferase-like monooxygenase
MKREVSVAFQSDKQAAAYAALARQVEEYGFDALSVYGDLMFQPPIGPLLLMAQATTRIRLGPASINPYTMHPVEIAGQIARGVARFPRYRPDEARHDDAGSNRSRTAFTREGARTVRWGGLPIERAQRPPI